MLQLFPNLIGNVIEALPRKGTLQMRARCTDVEAHVLFADNGHGIRRDIRLRIFELFFTRARRVLQPRADHSMQNRTVHVWRNGR
jgi:signal transduction histidine kinase